MTTTAVTKWEARIDGKLNDLEYLATIFEAPPLVISLQHDGSGYRLYHKNFDSIIDRGNSAEVFARANAIAEMLSGILVYERQSDMPLSIGAVYAHDANGVAHTIIQVKGAKLRITGGSVVMSVGPVNDGEPAPPLPPFAVRLWQLAQSDKATARVLAYLNAGDMATWSGLYRIFEVVREDVGSEDAIERLGWASRRQIERFRRSANSPTASGLSARHAKEPTQPPPNPMSPHEAEAFVRGLLDAWFQSKGNHLPP